jgi:oligosaccharide repeat unit polymerase
VTLLGVLGLLPLLVVWGFIYVRISRHPLDPIALFCYMFFLFYLFRDVVITFGWDTPYPDGLFNPPQTGILLFKASLTLSLFLVAFAAAYVLLRPWGNYFVRLVPVTWNIPSVRSQRRLMTGLTIAATAISVFLLARYGGFGGILRAAKVTKSLAGSYALRVFPAIGAIVSASLCLTLLQRRKEGISSSRFLVAASLTCALLNAGYVYLWGSRTVVAVVIFILIGGQWLLGRGLVGNAAVLDEIPVRRRPRVFRVLVSLLVLLVVVVGLREIRDTALSGHYSTSTQGQSELRKISVETNSTYFDATLLALRDWPSTYRYRHGEDFTIGLDGVIPRPLWAGKPQDITDGAWFRQIYQPNVKNGWPLGAVGDWYLNFGTLGVLVGGLFSGFLFTGLMAAWRRAPLTPFTLASLISMVIFVVPTGFDALSPLRWFEWAFPLLICAWYLGRRPRSSAPQSLYLGESVA